MSKDSLDFYPVASYTFVQFLLPSSLQQINFLYELSEAEMCDRGQRQRSSNALNCSLFDQNEK